jgi:hypothetical protein
MSCEPAGLGLSLGALDAGRELDFPIPRRKVRPGVCQIRRKEFEHSLRQSPWGSRSVPCVGSRGAGVVTWKTVVGVVAAP